MNIKTIALLSVLFLLSGIFGYTQKHGNTTANEQVPRHLKEVEWPKAYREQGTILLNKILADEFEFVELRLCQIATLSSAFIRFVFPN